MRRTTPRAWVVPIALLLVVGLAGGATAASKTAWLGITTQSIDDDLREGLDLRPSMDGLLVNSVFDGSPADHAGVRKGDVLLSFDGKQVTEPDRLREMVLDAGVGHQAQLIVWRDGERRTIDVELGERDSGDDETPVPAPRTMRAPRAPEPPEAPEAPEAPGTPDRREIHIWRDGKELSPDDLKGLKGLGDDKMLEGMRMGAMRMADLGRGRLGVRIESLNDDMADALGAAGAKGVLVSDVVKDTPAERAGIRAGDIITRVGDQDVADPEALQSAVRDRDAGRVTLGVIRHGSRRSVDVTLEARRDEGGDTGWVDGLPRVKRLDGNPETRREIRVYRQHTGDGASEDADLREQLRQLREQLQELREQLEQMKH